MPKITLETSKCIGCGTCWGFCDKIFEMGENGKSHLKGAKISSQKEELEVEEPSCATEAAQACPVQCIKIEF